MREYGSVHTCFWSNTDIQSLSSEAKLLALYLLTGPHTNMLGCFRLPVGYVAEDLNWSFETVSKRLTELLQKSFATHDDTSNWVLVHNFLEWNVIENPNQAKSIRRLFEQAPAKSTIYNSLINALLKYGKHLESDFVNRLETISKAFRNQEQDQEQKQDLKKEKQVKEKNSTEKNLDAKNYIFEIFQFWQITLGHLNAKLDKKRKACIRQALALGFSVEQLQSAIVGCSQTPHNLGHNERGERYDGLHVIFKNADNIERFIRNCHNPPTQNFSDAKNKKHFSTVNATRLIDDNFENKQYTQTPLTDITWLKTNE